MAMPSRKKIAAWSLIAFIVIFFAAVAFYFGPSLISTDPIIEDAGAGRDVNLFPFGGNDSGSGSGQPDNTSNNSNTGSTGNPNIISTDSGERLPRLRQIVPGPVIGATVEPTRTHSGLVGAAIPSTTDRSIENMIRYVELGTGHVFEGSTLNGRIERISNTTVPKINEALFVGSERVLLRYTDDSNRIKTFSAELVNNFSESAATDYRLQGIFLDDDMVSVGVAPDGNLISSVKTQDGVTVYTHNALGENKTQIFDSPVSEWRVDWFGNNREAIVQTTPSYESFGMAYTLDSQNGSFVPYISARKALGVVTTNDRDYALVSIKADGDTELYAWNRNTNQYIDLGLGTFAEKCVWAEERARFYCAVPIENIQEAEPDLWYQGVSHYSDQYWEIDPVTGITERILSPIEYTNQSIDTIDLTISNDEQFLYFRDKTTRSLWSIQIDYERNTNPNPVVTPETNPQEQTDENIDQEEPEETASPDETFFEN